MTQGTKKPKDSYSRTVIKEGVYELGRIGAYGLAIAIVFTGGMLRERKGRKK